MRIREFIPPIVWRLRSAQSMKIYDSFKEAQADSQTYNDPAIIKVVSSKTEAYRNALIDSEATKTASSRQTVQNMFVLSYIWSGSPLNILEIGGACGANYFKCSHLLPSLFNSWHIVETSPMVAAGRELFLDDRLTFHDDLNATLAQFESLDLIIAQGVLQYMPDPLQTLARLLEYDCSWVYITRVVVGVDIEHPIITKQITNLSVHGPGKMPKGMNDKKTSQPLTIVPYKAIFSSIKGGYSIAYSFAEGGERTLRIGSKTVRTSQIGFLLSKNGQ